MAFPVQLHLAGLAGPLASVARDLSAGGFCAATPSCFAMQDLRRVTLMLPEKRLDLQAEGRWQLEMAGEERFFTGIQFVDIPGDALEPLWDLVHRQTKLLTVWLSEQRDFQQLGLHEAMDLVQLTRLREVRAGKTLYWQGRRDDSIFVVHSGEVVLERRTPEHHKLAVGRIGPGQVLGGVGVVADLLPGETAVVDRDASLLEIARGSFESLQRSNPALAFRIASIVTHRHIERIDGALRRLLDDRR
jgi:hypothetical protein